jgi:putative transposase
MYPAFRMPRRLIALDEKCVKVNGLEYWVYVAVDVDKNEIISMRAFPYKNVLATKLFVEEVLEELDLEYEEVESL